MYIATVDYEGRIYYAVNYYGVSTSERTDAAEFSEKVTAMEVAVKAAEKLGRSAVPSVEAVTDEDSEYYDNYDPYEELLKERAAGIGASVII